MIPEKDFSVCVRELGNLSGTERKRLLKMLSSVWDRSFMNYRDGHWHDPENEYAGELDLPENAVPFLRLLLAENEPDSVRLRDVVQGYVEFFAAVKDTLFSASRQQLLLPVLLEAEKRWQDRAGGFRALINSIPISSDASADRRTHTQCPSRD